MAVLGVKHVGDELVLVHPRLVGGMKVLMRGRLETPYYIELRNSGLRASTTIGYLTLGESGVSRRMGLGFRKDEYAKGKVKRKSFEQPT
ncbi:hypothetical protein Tco_1231730 [Tanacetum coccineum]